MTILDLCRYQSLRIPSIAFCFLILCFDLLYFSHTVITDSIGLNPSLNLILMSGTQVLSFVLLNWIIPCIRRRFTSRIMALFGLIISVILLLVKIPSNCEGCSLAVVQIGLIMMARFCIGFMLGLFFVSQSQFYPASVKGAGVGAATFMGLMGSVFSQIVLTDAKQLGINPFLIIAVVFLLASIGYQWMPETYQMQPQDQIEEMREPRSN